MYALPAADIRCYCGCGGRQSAPVFCARERHLPRSAGGRYVGVVIDAVLPWRPSRPSGMVTLPPWRDCSRLSLTLRRRGLTGSPKDGLLCTSSVTGGVIWTASSDDVDVAVALIDGGADLETPGGSIGTPLDNAVDYACWHVPRLLAARGARVDKLWHAAALDMLGRVEDLLVPGIGQEQISQAFWHACVAGQRRAAERLLNAGADLNWSRTMRTGQRWTPQPGSGLARTT